MLCCAFWGVVKATTDDAGGCGAKPVFPPRKSDSEKPGESAKVQGVRCFEDVRGDVWKPSDLSKMSQLRLGIKAGVDETPGTVYTEFSESPKNPKANKIRRRYYSWQNRK